MTILGYNIPFWAICTGLWKLREFVILSKIFFKLGFYNILFEIDGYIFGFNDNLLWLYEIKLL